MKILHVVGARPNFMKIAPVMAAVARAGFAQQVLVHTGQHYDAAMSKVFFDDLGLPAPDVYLGVGSGSHATQTAKIMIELERVCLEAKPDLVMVVGDVNSTLAGALVAAKLVIPCAHLEAGLRSFDRGMPEEINRLVTDRVCEILLTPSQDGDAHLLREGVPASSIHRVGNVMVDSLLAHLPAAQQKRVPEAMGLTPGQYVVVTLHRPSNVDDAETLPRIMRALATLAREAPVVFPVHPRTRARLADLKLLAEVDAAPGLRLCEPLGYLDFLSLFSRAKLLLTDSGGVQEETTALGIPCLTLRENTERPVTVDLGTNTLVGTDMDLMLREARRALAGQGKAGRVPELWDGQAAERVAQVLKAWKERTR